MKLSSTRNGTVDSQVKSNPRNNLLYGQHHCGKGRNARGIITAGHRGGGHKRLYRKIDFRRNEKDIYGRIVTIEYDPNRNAYICLIHYRDGSLIEMKQKFSSMIDRYTHQQLRIGLVSPQQISTWSKKILPNGEIVGEVTKPYVFHYKTNKPEKDGLFCERIFGPIKSGICACGNYRVIGDEKEDPQFCEQCGVEFVDSRIQRYQMGYIKLAYPVMHVWYLKRLPSYIVNLLDKPLNELKDLVYYDYSLVEWKELEEEEPTGNEWEDRKVGRRKDFFAYMHEIG
ncbi:hypothetical protein R6Q59_006368 [Mikania micrantha]